jgi:hypothetical protein
VIRVLVADDQALVRAGFSVLIDSDPGLEVADISFFVGLPVAGLRYYAFTRSVDVAAETRIAEAEAAELERAAAQHRTSLAGRGPRPVRAGFRPSG